MAHAWAGDFFMPERGTNGMNTNLRKLVFSAMFLALCMVLPFLTMQIPEIGSMLSPMHFPVLLCGFVCGPVCGLVVGLIAPLLRSLLFGMPPLFPTATAMAMEMLFYGGMTGLMHLMMPRKPWALWVSLIVSMLVGRVMWGLTMFLLMTINGKSFTMAAFLAGAFIKAWPGIVCQLALIPPLVMALDKAGLMTEGKKFK